MRCPKCDFEDSRVIDSRESKVGPKNAIRRRRVCFSPKCDHRWTTYEIAAEDHEQLVDGSAVIQRARHHVRRAALLLGVTFDETVAATVTPNGDSEE